MNELKQLAQFVVETTYETLPMSVVDRAHMVLRDSVGAIVGGMAEPENAALADYASRVAAGPVTLLAHSGRTSPDWATLVHGTAGTTLEMDEGHAFARGHAAIHAVPTALAVAQALGASGRNAVTAMIVGYEVAARAGTATRLRHGVHPFGTWGVLGAAAVGAWFRRFDAQGVTNTLELAASYAIAPSFKSAILGANVRNTFAGVVNRLGLLAVDLNELGFQGEQDGVRTVFGELLGDSFAVGALVDGLGTDFEMMRGYFKPYSACRYTHAAVDAVLKLRGRNGVNPDTVARIDVATYDIAAELRNSSPGSPLAARFSLPYVVAATMLNGSAGPEIFVQEIISSQEVLALAARVRVSEDEAFTAMTPAQRPARVTIHFHDGRRLEQTVTGSKGDPDQPMTEAELKDKFLRLVSPAVGRERARRAWQRLGRLSEQADLEETFALLAGAESGGLPES